MGKIREFFSDMKKEVKRIRWCKGKELFKDVMITLLFILFFAIFFVILQYLIAGVESIDFSSLIERISDIF